MSDPDRIDDTEPTGCPPPGDEGPEGDDDEATVPIDPPREDPDAGATEPDTDDFLRWLPTMALGHRRRTQIVERSSSDGADFAAYACEGRPATTSGPPRIESAVKVALPQGSDLDRDAPTVLTEERAARRRWRTIAWAFLGVAAAGAAIAGWAERRIATERPLLRGEAVATTPMRIPMHPVEATEPTAPFRTPPTDVAGTAAEERAPASSAVASDAARKSASTGGPKPFPSSARRRALPMATAPTPPAKDEFFEAP